MSSTGMLTTPSYYGIVSPLHAPAECLYFKSFVFEIMFVRTTRVRTYAPYGTIGTRILPWYTVYGHTMVHACTRVVLNTKMVYTCVRTMVLRHTLVWIPGTRVYVYVHVYYVPWYTCTIFGTTRVPWYCHCTEWYSAS